MSALVWHYLLAILVGALLGYIYGRFATLYHKHIGEKVTQFDAEARHFILFGIGCIAVLVIALLCRLPPIAIMILAGMITVEFTLLYYRRRDLR